MRLNVRRNVCVEVPQEQPEAMQVHEIFLVLEAQEPFRSHSLREAIHALWPLASCSLPGPGLTEEVSQELIAGHAGVIRSLCRYRGEAAGEVRRPGSSRLITSMVAFCCQLGSDTAETGAKQPHSKMD